MQSWLDRLITSVCTAGFVAAVCAGYIRFIKARHQIRRETRQDEISVLHGQLARIDEKYKEIETELGNLRTLRDREVAELKSELTAALIENGTLRLQEKHLLERNRDLTKQNRELEERIGRLEAEVAELRKAS